MSIRRYLEEVPLGAEEKAMVEGDIEKLESFICKLDRTPTPDGRTPLELDQQKNDVKDSNQS